MKTIIRNSSGYQYRRSLIYATIIASVLFTILKSEMSPIVAAFISGVAFQKVRRVELV